MGEGDVVYAVWRNGTRAVGLVAGVLGASVFLCARRVGGEGSGSGVGIAVARLGGGAGWRAG